MLRKECDSASRQRRYLNVNKNPFSQLNYGTGKDVSEATISDAKEKLKVEWSNHSYATAPVLRGVQQVPRSAACRVRSRCDFAVYGAGTRRFARNHSYNCGVVHAACQALWSHR